MDHYAGMAHCLSRVTKHGTQCEQKPYRSGLTSSVGKLAQTNTLINRTRERGRTNDSCWVVVEVVNNAMSG